MKKKLWGVIVLTVLLTGCSFMGNDTDDIGEYVVPHTDEVIVSPELPDKIVVNGTPVSVVEGDFLKPGDTITLSDLIKPTETFDTMQPFSLNELTGWKVIHIVPSLDTPICSLQTRQLNYAATEMPDVNFITISADLPFALSRFVDFNDIRNMKVYSDFQTGAFLKNNKLFLEDYGLATRAIMVLDENNEVQYIQYAKEVTEELELFDVINFVRQNYNK